jgi:hypothetical protein
MISLSVCLPRGDRVLDVLGMEVAPRVLPTRVLREIGVRPARPFPILAWHRSAPARTLGDSGQLCSGRACPRTRVGNRAAPEIVCQARAASDIAEMRGGASPRASPADRHGHVDCYLMTDFRGCSPGDPGVPSGGWAARASDCAQHVAAGFDGCLFEAATDAHGCVQLTSGPSCACACGQAACDGG